MKQLCFGIVVSLLIYACDKPIEPQEPRSSDFDTDWYKSAWPPNSKPYVNAINGLVLHSTPSTNAPGLELIPDQERLQFLNETARPRGPAEQCPLFMMLVSHRTQRGWVCAEYLVDTKPTVQSLGDIVLRGYEENRISMGQPSAHYRAYRQVQPGQLVELRRWDHSQAFSLKLAYINDDLFPDLLEQNACCFHGGLSILFGTKEGTFTDGPGLGGCDAPQCDPSNPIPRLERLGKCSELIVTQGKITYSLDCTTKQFITPGNTSHNTK